MSQKPVTVVTGAAGALGSALVPLLLERGHVVAAADKPGKSLTKLSSLSADVVAVALDVGEPKSWERALSRLKDETGEPTGAVLLAGGWAGGAPHHDSDADTWNGMIAANADTVQHSLRALVPGFVKRATGSIVVIGSRAVERPWEAAGAAAYGASKAAVVALARAVAEEVRSSGVRINSVLPGTIATPANRSAMPDADQTEWVSMEAVSKLVAFLLSNDAEGVTGAAIPVYGRG